MVTSLSPLSPAHAFLAIVAAVAFWPAFAAGQTAPTPPVHPTHVLHNDVCKVTVYLPDAKDGYYRGPRFDWSGIIGRVEYRGHRFYADWKIPQNPEGNDDATGTAEEFGMQAPLGYKDAELGMRFLKIGVGYEKRKKEDYYQFWVNYPILQLMPFKITKGDTWIEFQQEAPGLIMSGTVDLGYNYHYTKRLDLDPAKPIVTITHTLKNTGTKAIDTNWYCHNFTRIDDDLIGKDYEMEFGFDPTPDALKDAPKDVVRMDGRKVTLLKTIPESLKTSFGNGKGTAEENRVTIRNTRTGAAVEIAGDTPIKTMAIFAVKTALCPEPFLEFYLEPGKEVTWKTVYTYSAPEAAR